MTEKWCEEKVIELRQGVREDALYAKHITVYRGMDDIARIVMDISNTFFDRPGFSLPLEERFRHHDLAMGYLMCVLRVIDEVLREGFIGTYMAPFIDEAAAHGPIQRSKRCLSTWAEYWGGPGARAESAAMEAQIAHWRRDVQEAPLIDACTLVVRALSDAVHEALQRLAGFHPDASNEGRKAEWTYIEPQLILVRRLTRELFLYDLISRFDPYIERDPETVALRREEEALRREYPPQS